MAKKASMLDSLSLRLTFIFIGLAVAPLMIVSAIVGQRSFISLEQQSLTLQRKITEIVSGEIGAFIEGRENELILLDEVFGLGARELKEQRVILSNALHHQRAFQEVVLLNANGQEQIRLSRTHVVLEHDLGSRAENEAFQFPTAFGQTYFGPVRFDDNIREPLLTISIPLFDQRSGKVMSVLLADLRFKKIWDLLADIELPNGVDAYVIDRAGRVVAHKNPAVVLRGTRLNLPEANGRAEGLSGTEVIIVRETLPFGDEALKVVAEQPVSAALELANSNLLLTGAITAAAFVLAIVLVVFSTRQIVKPIEALARSARAISLGDFSLQVKESGRGEVGELASAFNTMRRQLQLLLKGLGQEITDRKQAEETLLEYSEQLEATINQLQETQQQLLRQEKLATIGQMSGSIAHELRNPLSAIKQASFYLQRLHKKGKIESNNPKVNEHLALIVSEVQMANGVINNLLDMTRLNPPHREVINLRVEIMEVTRSSDLQDQVQFKLDFSPEPFLIWADRLQMRQVFSNLLTNAAQACDRNGLVTVSAQAEPGSGQVQICVRDNGCGVETKFIDKVFEPLYTTRAKGVGLGLSICKQIVEKHDGSLALTSQINQGTTVRILLPHDTNIIAGFSHAGGEHETKLVCSGR